MEQRRNGEWRRRSEADGEEGNQNSNCGEMEKLLNDRKEKGRKDGEEEQGWLLKNRKNLT